jgi:hypothetical protein
MKTGWAVPQEKSRAERLRAEEIFDSCLYKPPFWVSKPI